MNFATSCDLPLGGVILAAALAFMGLAAFASASAPAPPPPQEEEALPQEGRAVLEDLLRLEKQAAARLEEKIKPLREAAEKELRPAREAAARKLRELQDKHTKAGELDEALALREAARRVLGILPDPGALHLQETDIGKILLFEVRGSTRGSVWGSEVYTADSHLGTAAVHAGLLAPGQKGVVRVRVLGAQQEFFASTKNGVTTIGYGPWPVSFTLEPVKGK